MNLNSNRKGRDFAIILWFTTSYTLSNPQRPDSNENTKQVTDKFPLGSGAIESAMRRVVNLRLKGGGIFWHESNANALLLLRSYYKAG